jgi:RimJ/RimL family protein N-acetyltransferase
MAQADCAISAAGGTVLELLCLGVPTLAGAIADNQRLGGESLASRQLIRYVGGLPSAETETLRQAIEQLWLDEPWRDRLSQNGWAAVDGSGAQRTAAWLRYGLFRLRSAREADSAAFWELRNDEDVRANAFNTQPVPWADHQSWYSRKLSDVACRLWVIESDNGEWLGQVRWDIDPRLNTAVFSFALLPSVRGWGLASRVIRRACEQLLEEFPNLVLQAHVKPHNVASRKAFLRVGFEPRQDTLLELASGLEGEHRL